MSKFLRLASCTLVSFAFATGIAPLASANDESVLCKSKEEEVLQQIEFALERGHAHRVDGLERALEGIRDGCTDESVLSEAEEDVRDSLHEVRERQDDLDEALESGDENDVNERRVKLEEATAELEMHTRHLESLHILLQSGE